MGERREAKDFSRAGLGRFLRALVNSSGDLDISPEEIPKSPREIGISLFDLRIFLCEIGISSGETLIAPQELGKPKRKTTSDLKALRPFQSRQLRTFSVFSNYSVPASNARK